MTGVVDKQGPPTEPGRPLDKLTEELGTTKQWGRTKERLAGAKLQRATEGLSNCDLLFNACIINNRSINIIYSFVCWPRHRL